MTLYHANRAYLLARRLFVAFAAAIVAVVVCAPGAPASAKDAGDALAAAVDSASESNGTTNDSKATKEAFPGFRFWKAPADAIDRWPWGDSKYYPVSVELFQEWLDAEAESARLHAEDSVVSRGVVPTLELNAKFDGVVLNGDGTYRTTLARAVSTASSDEPSDRQADALYRVRPFSFALSPRTEMENDLFDKVGVYADGRIYLPNSQAKERRFLWSQRGVDDKRGHVSFNLEFPNSARTELLLETSGDARVFVTEGVVREITLNVTDENSSQTEESETNEPDSAAYATDEPLKRVWRVYFGGAASSTLTILRGSDAYFAERRTVGVRQESYYRLSREGAEVAARFEFERSEAQPKSVTLTLAAPLRLVSLEWGALKDAQLEPTIATGEDCTTITVRVPELKGDSLDELKASAFCPICLDEIWNLPAVRLEGSDLEWKETTQRLAVVRPLAVTSAIGSDASQAREAFRTRQEGVDALTFRLFEPTGYVSVKLRSLQNAPTFDSATDCLVVANDISAKTTLFFNFDETDAPRVSIPLASGWKLDSVLSASDESISWLCEDEGGQVETFSDPRVNSEDASPSVLSISFKKAPPKNQPARVTLSARRLATLDSTIDVDKLCPIDLSNNLYGAHALALRAESPYQVKLTTRNGRPYTTPKGTQNFIFNESLIRDALPASLGGSRLYFGLQTVDAVASLDNLRSNYTTSGRCDCDVYCDELANPYFVENWRLHCEPLSGSRVERIVFFASASSEHTIASDVPWKWSTSTEPERFYTASRLSQEETAALRVPKDCAAYEIRLTASRSVPFDLNLRFSSRGSSRTQLPLIFLPESTNSSFETIVSSPQGFPFRTEFDGMVESTPPASNGELYELLRNAFRYNPTPTTADKLPSLNFTFERPDDALEELTPAAWCWFETLDSYYEANGEVRNRASFYLENHGRAEIYLTLDESVPSSAIRGVWLGSELVPWRFSEESRAVVLALPLNRKFVCVSLEFHTSETPLLGARRLTPRAVTCSFPTISSVWNAWTPPQYQTGLDATSSWLDERVQSSWFMSLASIFTSDALEGDLKAVADRFAERLGDRSALAAVVAEAKREAQKGSASTAQDGPLTWGDALGSSYVVDRLFRPLASKSAPEKSPTLVGETVAADSAQDGSIESPFGALERSLRPFALYIDRLATADVAVTPETPLPEGNLVRDGGRILEQAGLVLLVLDDNSALLTTSATLSQNNNVPTIPLRGPAILRCQRAQDATALRGELSDYFGRRYVSPDLWSSVDNLVNPWLDRAQDEATIGWNRTTINLDRAGSEAYVLNRYFLWSVELFCFIAFVTFAWRFRLVNPSFCLGTLGVCLAALNVVFFEWISVLRGVAWGALCVWGFCLASKFAPLGFARRLEGAARDEKKAENDDSRETIVEDDDSSTQACIDFNRLPLAERLRLQESKYNGPDRQGTTTMKTTMALVCAALFTLAAFAQEPRESAPAPSAVESSEQVSAPDSTYNAAPDDAQEPYRVFVPIDENNENVGDYYWVSSEFYDRIRKTIKERPRERNWRVVDARYEGVVNYNSLAETTTLFNLKATYTVVLDSTSATISIPALPLAPDVGAKFDRQTITSAYEEANGEYSFEIDDVAPGEHSLELTLVPPQFSETTSQISLPIVSVPSARLELSVPDDAPRLDVPNARGKIVRGAGRLSAELGAVDRLIVTKQEASRASKTTLDVEQLFMVRPRANQADVRSIFHYQASGGKIKTLDVECDPLYAFSGYCQCEEGEIESVELPTSQNNAIHVTFKEPIGGAFTLSVNFVARAFSGVGRLQFPNISTRGARSSKSWLAIAPSADVECVNMPATTVTNAAFQKAWGASDDAIAYAYDLAVSTSASVSIRLKPSVPLVEYTTTFLFGASEIEIRCDATIESRSDLFRLTVETPKPFVVDSVALVDAQGAPLDEPEFFMSEDGLTLCFQNPFKGVGRLQIVGRTKTSIDVRRKFPLLHFREVLYDRRFARVYCSSDVYIDWIRPKEWTPVESSRAVELGEEPVGDYRYVDSYELSSSASDQETLSTDEAAENDDASAAEKADAEASTATVADENYAIVRVNSPRFVGNQWTVLYRGESKEKKDPKPWRAVVDFQFVVESGRVDSFVILSDEAFTWKLDDPDGLFVLSETMTSTGARAILVDAKKTIDGVVNARLWATFKNEPENIRLPRFQLAPYSAREDVSEIKRYAFLPERQNDSELRWSIQDMRPVAPDSAEAAAGATTLTKSTVALAKLGPAVEIAATRQVPKTVVDESGMTGADFLEYALGPYASASLASSRDVLTASRARHVFYVNAKREFFGSASFTIRQSALDYCVFVAPAGCEILEATVNGSRRLVERLDENRWRVYLDSTPYVKRLDVAFRGNGTLPANTEAAFGVGKAPVFALDLLQIENVTPERTVWLCVFDALDSAGAHWKVYQRDCDDDFNRDPSKAERDAPERDPALMTDAADLLFRMGVENAAAMLEAYESDLAQFSSGSQDDLPRLRAWWDRAWRENENSIAQFYAYDLRPDVLSEGSRRAISSSLAPQKDSSGDSNDPTSRWNAARYREIMEQKKTLDELYRVENSALNEGGDLSASAQSLWTFESGSSTCVLVGMTNSHVGRVVFAATPKSFDFFASSYANAAFILALTAVLLHLIRRGKRSRRASVVVGALVALWATGFFLFGSKQVGLIGAAALAIGPTIVSALWRRLANRRRERLENNVSDDSDASGSTLEPHLIVDELDPGTTASLATAIDAEDEQTRRVPFDYEAPSSSRFSSDDSSVDAEIFD